ncbi:sugar porter family MFS transporter [Kocuria marina]|uniref:sugar porter family MFS transporter n=1 Tax=Kocuria marina TaxID=223184 RepID=UPI0022E55D06|nr:sugar porter family MFS transporter [Kocuria marina]
MTSSRRPRLLMIASTAALGFFLFGYDTAVINGAIDALADQLELGNGMKGFAVSSALLGCVAGAWFAGPLANRFGRIPIMLASAVLFFVSAIGTGLAFGVGDLILWRVVGGLGVGAASVIAPTYIAEISPAAIRGRLVSLQGLAGVTGIAVSLFVDAALAWSAGGAANPLWFDLEAWRWMFIAEALPAIAYGLAALRIPESPRYLVSLGREAAAAEILHACTGVADTAGKIKEIRRSIAVDHRMSLRDLADRALGLKPIVWVGILVAISQQFVGINVIFYYSTTLWRSIGFDESNALLITAITSLINIGATVLSLVLIDRVGRKRLMLSGSLGMATTLGIMALAFSQATLDAGGTVLLPGLWGPVALVSANLFVAFFGATWGSVMWVLLGEMFPNQIRAGAMAVATSANWLANFTISTTFPLLAAFSLTASYGFYALCALASFFLVRWFVQETNGVELEEMGNAPRDSKPLQREI